MIEPYALLTHDILVHAPRFALRIRTAASRRRRCLTNCSAAAFSSGYSACASCLGHIACRRQHSVLMLPTDRLFKQLKAARLDASYDHALRRVIRVDLLILDDFGLHPLKVQETQDL